MRTLWLLLLLLPVPALRAELQLWLVGATKDPLTWTPVPGVQPARVNNGATLEMSAISQVRENDILDLRFELRNTPGSPAVTVNTFRMQQNGSSEAFIPLWKTLPGTLAGGAKFTFEIRFLPPKPLAYEAILVIDNMVFTLRGSASGRTVMLETDTLGQRQLINGSTSDFGNVRLGESYIKSYRIVNRTDAPLMLAPPTLQGEIDSFFLLQAPESNRTVPPNGFYEFKAEFRPARTGLINATLTVDGRTIKLVSNGLEGEVPDFRLLPSAADVESVSQADARIEVVSAAAQALSGTLTLVFEGDVGGMPDDTNIRFIATGNRSIAFTVPAGSTRALFAGGSSDAARFQTGAASGKIRLVAKLGQWERSAQLNIRSDAPKLASGSLRRGSGTLTVNVNGFDNMRSASTAVFFFFDTTGKQIGGASGIEAPVGDVFGTFFRASPTGGVFQLRADFPVQGDVNAIESVQVALKNSLGLSQRVTAR